MYSIFVALIITVIILLLWLGYARFIYRKNPTRIAGICAAKYSMIDALTEDELTKNPGTYYAVDETSLEWGKNSTGETVTCKLELRDKETQAPKKQIMYTFGVVYGKNAQTEKLGLSDILI